ncbi:DddA-like double-stranded DNA deaminase toxin [Actinoplanes sp. NPDC051633]|uniref:DddA-like double-stranded DNA deaminase toxin n=1 Tax=Actinoplanes sp. NPDC051633 TaxID=3155670 RepID=UPI003433D23F
MAENVKETKPPEPPPKPREVPKPTERSDRSETPGRPPETQQSARQETREAVRAEHEKAHHFDSVAPGYDSVGRTELPKDWMRTQSEDFASRPKDTNRPTSGAFRYGDADSSAPTPVSSSPRDRSVGNDLDFSRLNDANGRPLRGEPRNAGDAEMRAAKQMRLDSAAEAESREPRHMDVVLDNTTCGSRDFDKGRPLTCDQLLPGAMPAGDTMTVYGSVDGGRTFYSKTFTGTGELIR